MALSRTRNRRPAAHSTHDVGQQVFAPAQAADALRPFAPSAVTVNAADSSSEQAAEQQAEQLSGTVAAQPVAAATAHGGQLSHAAAAELHSARAGGTTLPEPLRQPLETAHGRSFSDVRIHTDRRADQLSRDLSADAFTSGRDIFFRRGAYQPAAPAGRSLLHHELTHVTQQRSLQRPTIQRRLTTADELMQLTGSRGALLVATTSYSMLLKAMRSYEALQKSDPTEQKKGPRAELLQRMIEHIDEWLRKNPAERTKAGDSQKQTVLPTLRAQVIAEKQRIMDLRDLSTRVDTGTVTPPTPTPTPTPTPAVTPTPTAPPPAATTREKFERAAQKVVRAPVRLGKAIAEKVPLFFAGAGTGLQRTFGNDFSTQDVAGYDPKKNLTADEIRTILTVLDDAERAYQAHITAGDDPETARQKAYGGLPQQLQPSNASPQAFLTLKVRRQLLEEQAAAPVASRKGWASKVRRTGRGIGRGVKGLFSKGTDKKQILKDAAVSTGTAVAGAVNSTVDAINDASEKGGEIAGTGTDSVIGTSSAIMKAEFLRTTDLQGEERQEALEKIGLDPSDQASYATDILSLMNSAAGTIADIRSLFSLLNDLRKVSGTSAKLEVIKDALPSTGSLVGTISSMAAALLERIKRMIDIAKSTVSMVSKIPGASKAGEAVPFLGIATSFVDGLVKIFNMVNHIKRWVATRSILKDAKAGGSALVDILKGLNTRDKALASRAISEVGIAAVGLAGNILTVIPDPSGATPAVGAVMVAASGVASLGQSIVTGLADSYRAGVAQETARQTEAGVKGADLKVLTANSGWAITALILEAKKTPPDPIAERELVNLGIPKPKIATLSVAELRARALETIGDSENPQTVTQRITGLARKFKA